MYCIKLENTIRYQNTETDNGAAKRIFKLKIIWEAKIKPENTMSNTWDQAGTIHW